MRGSRWVEVRPPGIGSAVPGVLSSVGDSAGAPAAQASPAREAPRLETAFCFHKAELRRAQSLSDILLCTSVLVTCHSSELPCLGSATQNVCVISPYPLQSKRVGTARTYCLTAA